jgi:hypothetical protein
MKFLGLAAVVLTGLVAVSSTAAARDSFICNGVFRNAVYGDVVVPRDGACTLVNASVSGNVVALKNAFFQATGTRIAGSVFGKEAQTIFNDTGSKVSGSIRTNQTKQVFVFNSRVVRGIDVERATAAVQICGTTVSKGNISVERSGGDILIGDPLAVGCRGNSVRRGSIEIKSNLPDIEFVIRGNRISRGNLEVIRNTGPIPKIVAGNIGGDRLKCTGNGAPVLASANRNWDRSHGQCAKRRK